MRKREAASVIDWFWAEFRVGNLPTSDPEGICQCGTAEFIRDCGNPGRMHAFLLAAVFIDQMMYTHCQDIYREFRRAMRLPKLTGHPYCGMASPSWLVCERERMPHYSTDRVEEMFGVLVGALDELLREIPDGARYASRFVEAMEAEIEAEFDPMDAPQIIEAMRSAIGKTHILRWAQAARDSARREDPS